MIDGALKDRAVKGPGEMARSLIAGMEDVYEVPVCRLFFGLEETEDLADPLEYEETDSRAGSC